MSVERGSAGRHCDRHMRVWGVLLLLGSLVRHAAAADVPPPVPCRDEGVPNGMLSLDHAIELALCSNPVIQSAAASVLVRAAQLGEARSEYWPTLAGTVTELRENSRYHGSAEPASTTTELTVYGALSWRLFDFGGRSAASRAASKLLEVAMESRNATVQTVLGSVVEAYFDALTAKGLLGTKEEDESLARATLDSAERRLLQGNGAKSDQLQATTALARAALDTHRARANYEKSLAVLAYSVGLKVDTPYTVPDDASLPSTEDDKSLTDWLDEARQRHPAIAAARADVEAAQAQLDAAKSRGRPSIDLQANYYENGFPEEGLAITRQRDTTVGIGITIPLFDGFLNRYRVSESEAVVRVKQAALIDRERGTLTYIIRAYSDATAAAANLKASQNLLDAALASQASSKRRYEGGAADIVEILNAQTALAEARQERVRCLAEWRSSRLRLLATSGVLSDTAAGIP